MSGSLLSRSPHQGCLSNGSNGQTKQNLAVQHYQHRKQVHALLVLSPPSFSMAAKHGPCLPTLKTGSTSSKPSAWGKLTVSPAWSTRPTTGSGARSTPLWVHMNLFCQEMEWFGHVTCHCSLSRTIHQGALEVGQRRGRQRKCWMDNVKEWTFLNMPELLTRAFCGKEWKRISGESSLMPPSPPPPSPTTQSVKGLN